MLFNTYSFIAFFLLIYAVYRLLAPRITAQNILLLFSSYLFYSFWNWRFLGLIIISTLVDYFCALAIDKSTEKRYRNGLLILSLLVNLGFLGVFKYYDFFAESLADCFDLFGIPLHPQTLGLILPVGISFYTFQSMGYTIDVYRKDIEAERSLLNFALYVSFFPQLVAGPIERADALIPQLKKRDPVNRSDYVVGLNMLLLGYFKKVVIADTLAPLVDTVFADPSLRSGPVILCGVIGFGLQIYGDFAGYSLIARGTARLMGIRLMKNFWHPYLATSPQDFWRRWHISLSAWLRDYLYISLGGNRAGKVRTYFNLVMTMLLGGLWHGAAWHWVVWGFYHGVLLAATRWCGQKIRLPRGMFLTALSILLTFVLSHVGWILFRAETTTAAWDILLRIVTDWRLTPDLLDFAVPVVIILCLVQSYHLWQAKRESEHVLLDLPLAARLGVYSFLIFSVLIVGFQRTQFLYFQF